MVFNEENISIDDNYPVDVQKGLAYLLQQATSHEQEEANSIYLNFAQEAKKEGYLDITSSFPSYGVLKKIIKNVLKSIKNDCNQGIYLCGEYGTRNMSRLYSCL